MGFKQAWRIDERVSLLSLTPVNQELVVKGSITNSQAFEMSRVPAETQGVILRKVLSGELGTYNKLRSFVDGLIAIERQDCLLSLQSLTPSEERSISEFSSLFRSIERFIVSVNEKGSGRHFKKVVFHTDISVERMDLVIQQMMKLRKSVFEGAGIQDALKAV
ncbi:MAG: hypothetical protein ACE5GY_08565 [Thermodesulfobacteriota bacterium]